MAVRIRELMVGMATPPEWRYLPSGETGATLRDACYADLLARLGAAFPDVEGSIVAGEPGVPGVPDASGSPDGVAARIVYLTPEALVASLADDRRTIRRAARVAQEGTARRATATLLARFAAQFDLSRLERAVRARDAAGRMTWTEAAELAEHIARFRPCGIDPATVNVDEQEDGSFVVLVPVGVADEPEDVAALKARLAQLEGSNFELGRQVADKDRRLMSVVEGFAVAADDLAPKIVTMGRKADRQRAVAEIQQLRRDRTA